jgi:hypothetical protein
MMGQEYGIAFSPSERERFMLIDGFGVPMGNLKQIIAMSSSDRNQKDLQPGIPMDSIDEKKNELARWIYNARTANAELHGQELKFAIKGDAKLEYPKIKRVMDILQKQDVNSFNLVTGLRSENF